MCYAMIHCASTSMLNEVGVERKSSDRIHLDNSLRPLVLPTPERDREIEKEMLTHLP